LLSGGAFCFQSTHQEDVAIKGYLMPLLDHFHAPLSLERQWESFHAAWAPPAAVLTVPAVFADDFEVRVFSTTTGPRLVAAIELVSPRNKDRPEARQAFATKCASYLHQGISLIVIDIVTERHANLHNEILRLLLAGPSCFIDAKVLLYAAAYRPLRQAEREEIDIWPASLQLAAALPTLPLALNALVCLPVDLEATYMDACLRRRLV
jgi:hypothetical protein